MTKYLWINVGRLVVVAVVHTTGGGGGGGGVCSKV
jgi:hypothetical protein